MRLAISILVCLAFSLDLAADAQNYRHGNYHGGGHYSTGSGYTHGSGGTYANPPSHTGTGTVWRPGYPGSSTTTQKLPPGGSVPQPIISKPATGSIQIRKQPDYSLPDPYGISKWNPPTKTEAPKSPFSPFGMVKDSSDRTETYPVPSVSVPLVPGKIYPTGSGANGGSGGVGYKYIFDSQKKPK